jgi:potassium channel subfamily K
MSFFGWLAGGAAVFAKVEQKAGVSDWSFADAVSQHLAAFLVVSS